MDTPRKAAVNLQQLVLYSNHLIGSIPVCLGNLANLQWLYLNENELSGEIPTELMNLTALSRLDICQNHLYTTDSALREFLNSKQIGGDWERCQAEVNQGDLNGDGTIDLTDLMMALPVLAGISPSSKIYKEAAVKPNSQIGLEEAVYVLQKVSGLR